LLRSIDQSVNKKKDIMRLVPISICRMNAPAVAVAPVAGFGILK